jgi:hypothetical protein
MPVEAFEVIRRNFGHWDVYVKRARKYVLRGGPGEWTVTEDVRHGSFTKFKDQSAAMAWVCAELMHELLIAEGQDFTVIEGWNVSR